MAAMCANCGTFESPGEALFKRCPKCKLVFYCSRACHRAAWPSHQGECHEPIAAARGWWAAQQEGGGGGSEPPAPPAAATSSRGSRSPRGRSVVPSYLFLCSRETEPQCMRYRVFGLPSTNLSKMVKIKEGASIYLFNFQVQREPPLSPRCPPAIQISP